MSGPWENYQTAPAAEATDGPWARYGAAGATQPPGDAGAQPAPVAPNGAQPVQPPPPLSAVTGRTQVPRPRQTEDSTTGFITGNLNKGVAGLAGLPVDTIANVLNLGIAGYGYASGNEMDRARYGFKPPPSLIEAPVGGSEWIQNLMRRGNMITPAAEPESPGGRYAAAALQALPSAALGRPSLPQAPRAAGATSMSGMTGELAADIGGVEWRGVGSMAPGGRGLAKPPSVGEQATKARQGEAFAKAKDMGIPVPPRDLKPDKPQQKIQDRINEELGQPAGTPIDPKPLQNYRNAHWGDYEAVIKSPALAKGVQPTKAFQAEIQAIGMELEAARQSLPQTFKGMQPVLKLLGEYGYGALPQGTKATVPPRQQPIPPDVAVQAIKKLRADASANLSAHDKPEKIQLGMTQRRIAGSLENLIEENLTRTGDQGLMATFRQARTAIAKSHDVEASLDPVTRKVDASRLSKLQTEGRPLSGGMADLAEVGGAFPGATKAPKGDDYFTRRVTPMAVMHPQAMGAHWLSRLSDPITTSAPYQKFVVDPRSHLSPEQQQMLYYLSAARSSNQRDIPAPP